MKNQTNIIEPWPFGKIGLNFTVTLTTDVMDPVGAIENLAIAVFEMNLQNGIENSLDSKLDAALNALGDANVNNDAAARNSLAAFISAVEEQRGNKITSAQADQLRRRSRSRPRLVAARTTTGCPINTLPIPENL